MTLFKNKSKKQKEEWTWTYREENLEELDQEMWRAKGVMLDWVKEVMACQQLISLLPENSADRLAEQTHLLNVKHALLCAIGHYDDRRAEYIRRFKQYAEEVGGADKLNIRYVHWKDSHEVIRNRLMSNYN